MRLEALHRTQVWGWAATGPERHCQVVNSRSPTATRSRYPSIPSSRHAMRFPKGSPDTPPRTLVASCSWQGAHQHAGCHHSCSRLAGSHSHRCCSHCSHRTRSHHSRHSRHGRLGCSRGRCRSRCSRCLQNAVSHAPDLHDRCASEVSRSQRHHEELTPAEICGWTLALPNALCLLEAPPPCRLLLWPTPGRPQCAIPWKGWPPQQALQGLVWRQTPQSRWHRCPQSGAGSPCLDLRIAIAFL
mmetsp:Transcript_70262/g.154960  ORF Transcript_70262/g.154960 Transcript_70262/m.154960 type:complete len:243 (-) Transcript_70262:911-1639(-)